jgi:tetratricopeptide (TPR) repeat protein
MGVMRRYGLLLVILGAWPQAGCVLLQTDKAAADGRPAQQAAPAKKDAPPQPALTPTARATELERAGKLPEAVAVYESMRTPGNPDALLATKLLAAFYLRHDDLERSEQEYRNLLTANPSDAAVLSSLGDISSRRGQFGTAGNCYSLALQYDPANVSARSGLAMALAQQGAYDRSVTEYKKVLPSEADAQCKVAWVMNLRGDKREAFELYQSALRIEPGNAAARTAVAQLRQAGVAEATTVVRITTPLPADKRGLAELQPAPVLASSEGLSRLQMQRPTLPPVPEELFTEDVAPTSRPK